MAEERLATPTTRERAIGLAGGTLILVFAVVWLWLAAMILSGQTDVFADVSPVLAVPAVAIVPLLLVSGVARLVAATTGRENAARKAKATQRWALGAILALVIVAALTALLAR